MNEQIVLLRDTIITPHTITVATVPALRDLIPLTYNGIIHVPQHVWNIVKDRESWKNEIRQVHYSEDLRAVGVTRKDSLIMIHNKDLIRAQPNHPIHDLIKLEVDWSRK